MSHLILNLSLVVLAVAVSIKGFDMTANGAPNGGKDSREGARIEHVIQNLTAEYTAPLQFANLDIIRSQHKAAQEQRQNSLPALFVKDDGRSDKFPSMQRPSQRDDDESSDDDLGVPKGRRRRAESRAQLADARPVATEGEQVRGLMDNMRSAVTDVAQRPAERQLESAQPVHAQRAQQAEFVLIEV